MSDEILEMWVERLEEYGALCRGHAAATLRGKYVRRFDAQGLDPISAAYGEVRALQALHPLLEEPLLTPSPVEIAKGCREDAVEDYRREIRNEVEALQRLDKPEQPE